VLGMGGRGNASGDAGRILDEGVRIEAWHNEDIAAHVAVGSCLAVEVDTVLVASAAMLELSASLLAAGTQTEAAHSP